MKKYLFFCFCSFGMFSCNQCKEPEPTEPTPPVLTYADSARMYNQALVDMIFLPWLQPWGPMSAKKNGKPWEATAEPRFWTDSLTGFFGINIATFNEFNEFRELIVFDMIPKAPGLYGIGNVDIPNAKDVGVLYRRAYADGDVHGQPFFQDLQFKSQDYFELTIFDTIQRRVAGRFDLHLTDSLIYPYPAYIHFVEGVFDLTY